MDQLKKRAQSLSQQIAEALAKMELTKQEAQLNRLREHMEKPDFWQDNQKAQRVSKEEASLSKKVVPWLELKKSADELKEISGLGDESMRTEIEAQLAELEHK